MSFNRGDVLIAFVPNADGSPAKVRPVLVVQSDVYNARIKNLLIAAITSKELRQNKLPNLYCFTSRMNVMIRGRRMQERLS